VRGVFRSMELAPGMWAVVIGAGAILGVGLADFAEWPLAVGAIVGVVVLLLALVLYDRRRAYRSSATVLLALDRPTVDIVLAEARAAGLHVVVGKGRRDKTVVPADQIAVRCRRSHLDRFLAIVDRHSTTAG
jgi:hypothetical protein